MNKLTYFIFLYMFNPTAIPQLYRKQKETNSNFPPSKNSKTFWCNTLSLPSSSFWNQSETIVIFRDEDEVVSSLSAEAMTL